MAISLIDYSTLPSGPKVAGPPSVTVRDNGQVAMSSSAAKAFEGCNFIMIGADLEAVKAGKDVQVQFQGVATEPKGKEGKGRPISRGKELKNCTISMAAALRGILGYDYVKAGNQTYACQINEAKHSALFRLPTVLPAPKPKVARKRKPAELPATAAPLAPAAPAAEPAEDTELEF